MRQTKDFVKSHELMRAPREEIGQSKLLEIMKGLVSDGLFTSDARVSRAFPGLFLYETNPGYNGDILGEYIKNFAPAVEGNYVLAKSVDKDATDGGPNQISTVVPQDKKCKDLGTESHH